MNKEKILLEIDKKLKSFNLKERENYEKYLGLVFQKRLKE